MVEEKGEGEAEISSKEEEFLAICQLHGVVPSAPVGLQLKAVEAEYHSLREAGQTHKADQVQQLHAWKSKKVLEVGRCKRGLYLHISLVQLVLCPSSFTTHTHHTPTFMHTGQSGHLLCGSREPAVPCQTQAPRCCQY